MTQTLRLNHLQLETTLTYWGPSEIIRPLTGGSRNQAWLVRIGEQLRVAKTTRRSELALEWLTLVHDAAEECGFVVPRLVPNQDDALQVNGVTVEIYIDGRPPDQDDMVAIMPLLQDFHQKTTCLCQRPTFASSIQLLDQPSGGDVDFSQMPLQLVNICRDSWRHLAQKPQSVIHGDLNASNILITADRQPALIDWDESRVDVSLFDSIALAEQIDNGHRQPSRIEDRALLAWEVAVCWQVEHDYAQKLAEKLIS